AKHSQLSQPCAAEVTTLSDTDVKGKQRLADPLNRFPSTKEGQAEATTSPPAKTKAYPIPNLTSLVLKSRQMKDNIKNVINVIEYVEQQARLIVDSVITEKCKILKEARQECPLSPLLFILVLEVLSKIKRRYSRRDNYEVQQLDRSGSGLMILLDLAQSFNGCARFSLVGDRGWRLGGGNCHRATPCLSGVLGWAAITTVIHATVTSRLDYYHIHPDPRTYGTASPDYAEMKLYRKSEPATGSLTLDSSANWISIISIRSSKSFIKVKGTPDVDDSGVAVLISLYWPREPATLTCFRTARTADLLIVRDQYHPLNYYSAGDHLIGSFYPHISYEKSFCLEKRRIVPTFEDNDNGERFSLSPDNYNIYSSATGFVEIPQPPSTSSIFMHFGRVSHQSGLVCFLRGCKLVQIGLDADITLENAFTTDQ
ncbi:Matrix metallopeptidase 1, partial [Podarcis lilfordi]